MMGQSSRQPEDQDQSAWRLLAFPLYEQLIILKLRQANVVWGACPHPEFFTSLPHGWVKVREEEPDEVANAQGGENRNAA